MIVDRGDAARARRGLSRPERQGRCCADPANASPHRRSSPPSPLHVVQRRAASALAAMGRPRAGAGAAAVLGVGLRVPMQTQRRQTCTSGARRRVEVDQLNLVEQVVASERRPASLLPARARPSDSALPRPRANDATSPGCEATVRTMSAASELRVMGLSIRVVALLTLMLQNATFALLLHQVRRLYRPRSQADRPQSRTRAPPYSAAASVSSSEGELTVQGGPAHRAAETRDVAPPRLAKLCVHRASRALNVLTA